MAIGGTPGGGAGGGATASSGGAFDVEASRDVAAAPAEGRLGIVGIFVSAAHPRITGLWMGCGKAGRPDQPSYSKPILRSTRYSTISPSSTTAVDFTTSIVLMLRTVRAAVATAWRAASLHDLGLVPTISRMMITLTSDLLRLARRAGQSRDQPGAQKVR